MGGDDPGRQGPGSGSLPEPDEAAAREELGAADDAADGDPAEPERAPERRGSSRAPALVGFVVAACVGGVVRACQLADRAALSWNDTADFQAIARAGWTSPALWAGARAPGVPVLLKLLGGDGERYADAQAAFAVLCWAALCASVATVVAGRWPRVVAVTAVLALSVTTPVVMWERSVLSESPGISALALVVAAGLQVARGPSWRRVGLLTAALVPWLAVRDTHAVVALLGGAAVLTGVALVSVARRRRATRRAERTEGADLADADSIDAADRADGETVDIADLAEGDSIEGADRDGEAVDTADPAERDDGAAADAGGAPTRRARSLRPLAALGALAIGLGLLVLAGAGHGERHAFPTRNVFEVRVLPYPERVRWFADHGMPQASEFLGEDRRRAYREPGLPPVVYVADDDPELGEWLDWIEDEGQTALARYALTHPGYVVGEPLRVPERAFNNALGDRDFYAALDQRRVPLVDRLLARRTIEVLLVAGAVGGWAIGRGRLTPALATGVATALLAVPHGLVAWHSDGMETARHLVVPALQLHLGVLLMLVGLLPAAGRDARPEPASGLPSAHG